MGILKPKSHITRVTKTYEVPYWDVNNITGSRYSKGVIVQVIFEQGKYMSHAIIMEGEETSPPRLTLYIDFEVMAIVQEFENPEAGRDVADNKTPAPIEPPTAPKETI